MLRQKGKRDPLVITAPRASMCEFGKKREVRESAKAAALKLNGEREYGCDMHEEIEHET